MKTNKKKYPSAVKWLLCIGTRIRNRYESAQAIWEAMDGETPFPMARLAAYFGWDIRYGYDIRNKRRTH